MKNKSSVVSLLLLLVTVFISSVVIAPSPAFACTCIQITDQTPPTKERIAEYDAVFLGTVLERQADQNGPVYTFQVTTSWKGVDKSQFTIQTGSGSGDCGVQFDKGKTYLVYAQGPATNNYLWTDICTPTKFVTEFGGTTIGNWFLVTIYILVLTIGLIFAFFKRKKQYTLAKSTE